jgi:hypothetical protein
MGQYEALLNQALAWIVNHETLLAVAGGLLAAQGGVWAILHRRINRLLGKPADAPVTPLEAAARDVVETVVVHAPPVANIFGNQIIHNRLWKLREAILEDNVIAVARQSSFLARNGVTPPRSVAQCDEMLKQFETGGNAA